MNTINCPICHRAQIEEQYYGGHHKYSCPNCGCYMLDHLAYHALTDSFNSLYERDKAYMCRCASVMLERNLKKLNDSILIRYQEEKGLFFDGTGAPLEEFYPKSFFDKLERGFFNLVRAVPCSKLAKFQFSSIQYSLGSLLFVDGHIGESVRHILNLMESEGWLLASDMDCSFTMKGLDRFEEKALSPGRANAFLAMWFGVEGFELYHSAINKAVSKAGYHLQIVNKEEYNGFIMDKVINLINDSAFVIADISAGPERKEGNQIVGGVRGGVYWEAGYAAGQKKQVILTRKNDDASEERTHFDLQQYNQIRWAVVGDKIVTADGRDFVDAIEQRIRATIGPGKNVL